MLHTVASSELLRMCGCSARGKHGLVQQLHIKSLPLTAWAKVPYHLNLADENFESLCKDHQDLHPNLLLIPKYNPHMNLLHVQLKPYGPPGEAMKEQARQLMKNP